MPYSFSFQVRTTWSAQFIVLDFKLVTQGDLKLLAYAWIDLRTYFNGYFCKKHYSFYSEELIHVQVTYLFFPKYISLFIPCSSSLFCIAMWLYIYSSSSVPPGQETGTSFINMWNWVRFYPRTETDFSLRTVVLK
jgi:hypothetical protein